MCNTGCFAVLGGFCLEVNSGKNALEKGASSPLYIRMPQKSLGSCQT